MSDPYTEIVAAGHAFLEHGHIPRPEAVDRARAYWQRKADKAQAALAAIDTGDEQVFHQRGVFVARDRTEVTSDDR